VAEALTNAAKHSHASFVHVEINSAHAGDLLQIWVHDDGRLCRPAGGSGLVGLSDRAEALGGRLLMQSNPGRPSIEPSSTIARPGERCPPVVAAIAIPPRRYRQQESEDSSPHQSGTPTGGDARDGRS
jgi:hypothetical protein